VLVDCDNQQVCAYVFPNVFALVSIDKMTTFRGALLTSPFDRNTLPNGIKLADKKTETLGYHMG